MASRIKGITIELDGETKGLDKALSNVNKKSRNLQGELRDVQRLLKFDPGNTTLIAQKQKILADQVENTAEKLGDLKQAEKQVQRQFEKGEIGEGQYRAFQRELTETENKLEHFEDELKTAGKKVDKFGQKLKNAGKKAQGFGGGLKDAGSSMSAGFTAPVIAGLFAVTKGTAEFRENLSKLQTNAKQAGVSADEISAALVHLSGVTGGTEENVEALSNLLASGFTEEGMKTALEALAGAVIKFPETIKIEELSNGLQETISTGKAMGQFAEVLGRVGINVKGFNKKLKEAKKSGEAQELVLETLAKTGLAGVNKAYRKNNKELVKSNESSAKFEQTIAKLGETLAPVVTKITRKITQLIDWFNKLSPTMQNVILIVIAVVAAIGPLLVIVGAVISILGVLSTAAGALGIALLPLIGIIAGIIAAIGLLVAGFIYAYTHFESFRKLVAIIWNFIKQVFKNGLAFITALFKGDFEGMKKAAMAQMELIQSTIKKIWGVIKNIFYAALRWISDKLGIKFSVMKKVVDSTFGAIWQTIKDVWGFIKDTFKNALDFLVALVTGDFEGMADAIHAQMEDAEDFVSNILDNIIGFFTDIDLYDAGREIIQSAIDGIVAMKDNIVGEIKDIVGAVRDFWPFSPAKRGPLSDIDQMDFAGPITKSIENAKRPIEKATADMAQAARIQMPAMTGSGGEATTSTQPAHINLTLGNQDYELFVDDIFKTGTARLTPAFRR